MRYLAAITLGLASSCLCLLSTEKGKILASNFDSGAEGWQAYDYNGGIQGGGNVFYALNWAKTGGVRNSGHVWADDSQWRIDTPENPNSILPFIIYRSWVGGDALDLRNAEVSVCLRGDSLDLKGAKCHFWAFNNQNGTRWHFVGRPLAIQHGRWGPPQTFRLNNDERLWHRSWSRNLSDPGSLDLVLSKCDSYGLSFIGFSGEVTGKLSMDQLVIRFAAASPK